MDFVSLALWDRDFLDDDDLVRAPALLFSAWQAPRAARAALGQHVRAPTRDVAARLGT